MSENPESQPYDYDEVTRLRLQLHQAELQRDAFQKAFSTEVLKVVRVSIIQASIDEDYECSSLRDEVARLKAENKALRKIGEKLARKHAGGLFRRRWRDIDMPLLVEWLDATEGDSHG